MKRIGFSGTDWTGKTTTILRLRNHLSHESIDVISLSDLVRSCPYPMVEKQTLEGSRWMISQVLEIVQREKDYSVQIFDRTPLDILAFTFYAGYWTGSDHSGVSQQARDLVDYFDRIFLLRPSLDWPPEITPAPEQIGFALMMDFFMSREAERWNVSTTELPWDMDERIGILETYLKS